MPVWFILAKYFGPLFATRLLRSSSTCAERVDFGFAAGKADFSFDGRQLVFHISKFDYLTPFVTGGLRTPAITDVGERNHAHHALAGDEWHTAARFGF